jgi:hypothetical protein
MMAVLGSTNMPMGLHDMVQALGRVNGFAYGNYNTQCRECEKWFVGDKRAYQCLLCAVASYDKKEPKNGA